MKYDNEQIVETESYPNTSVVRKTRRKRKIDLLDIFIVQTIVCVIVSCGFMISRLITLSL